jgi:hypothetical protein
VEEGESGGYSDEEFDNDVEELEESIAKDGEPPPHTFCRKYAQ